MLKVLNKINEPKDLKQLSNKELEELAKEIREVLLKKLSIHGAFNLYLDFVNIFLDILQLLGDNK